MSNKSTNLDIEAVEKHEMTSLTPIANIDTTPEPTIESATPKLDQNNKDIEDEDQNVGYITQLDKDGNIQQVPIKFDGEDDADDPNPLADFMSGTSWLSHY